jgi:hypothetical protein
MKKFAIIGFFIVLLIVGILSWQHFKYPSSDERIRHQLPGTWINGPQDSKDSVNIDSDGNFVIKETFGTNEVASEGTWQVKDGFLIATTTKSSSKDERVGIVTKDKIIRVNDQELVFSSQGTTITWKRKK